MHNFSSKKELKSRICELNDSRTKSFFLPLQQATILRLEPILNPLYILPSFAVLHTFRQRSLRSFYLRITAFDSILIADFIRNLAFIQRLIGSVIYM